MAEKKEPKAKNAGGRPSSYKPEYGEQARKLCLLGAIDTELADFFGVTTTTIDNWKQQHPEFLAALKAGKGVADCKVAQSLYERATGSEWTEQVAVKLRQQDMPGSFREEVKIVEITKRAAPDTTAIIFWLKNRRPKDWRDKQEHEHAGKDGAPLSFTIKLDGGKA